MLILHFFYFTIVYQFENEWKVFQKLMQSQSPVSAIQLKTSQCICQCHLIRPVATVFDFIKNEMRNNQTLLYSLHNLLKHKTKQTTIILHQQFLTALPFSFSCNVTNYKNGRKASQRLFPRLNPSLSAQKDEKIF
jgi:hypothetical protein